MNHSGSSHPALKVLLVGGYGVFGGRIVELLEAEPRLTLVVAGRSAAKAKAFCAGRTPKAQLLPAAFDRDGDLEAQLASIGPDIVVDASGPFQAYGPGQYRLVDACLARAVSYLDLADGADFVEGISPFVAAAREKGIFVLSGVSSFPVLTAAVVRKLSVGMVRVETIVGGIAPSPYAGVGENVIRAIASYAGQPVQIRRDGAAAIAYPLTEQRRYTIATPGKVPLRNILYSLVDVPDLRALARLWPDARTIWMGAGPVPEVLHRAFIWLAWLVRLKLLPSLLPLAPLIHWVSNRLSWGEHRGGMFVEVTGSDAAGSVVKRSWHLLAEGRDGPFIPSMAVEGLVRRMLGGDMPAAGARAAVSELEVEDYARLFERRTIYEAVRNDSALEAAPLYARILGPVWDELPAEIRSMHNVRCIAVAEGRATIDRGRNPLARLAAFVMGFPRANADVPLSVRFEARQEGELWTRTFGEKSFSSHQSAGSGGSERLVCERFGPLSFAFALVFAEGRLTLVQRRWSAFGIPLPMWLCPRSNAYETSEDGRFRFHVEIGHPLTGLIVRYRGWLMPPKARDPAPLAGADHEDPGKLATLSTD